MCAVGVSEHNWTTEPVGSGDVIEPKICYKLITGILTFDLEIPKFNHLQPGSNDNSRTSLYQFIQEKKEVLTHQ